MTLQKLHQQFRREKYPERSVLGQALYNAIVADDGVLQHALNEMIRPWGWICENQGCSNIPTFTGYHELVYGSFRGLYGRGLSTGNMIAFRHFLDEDRYLIKRVRALEGEVIKRKAASGGFYPYQVRLFTCSRSGRTLVSETLALSRRFMST